MKKSIILTPTPDLKQSQIFYNILGFTPLGENPNLFSDGRAIIEISPNRTSRAGLKLFSKDWSIEIENLKKKSLILIKKKRLIM
ncbi:hypothetical protein [Shivajiella indica]|uniref:Uncharacterized protein n=1 Tax=Shivajiella indica TaxID=872115 RepID=A0ABW5BDW8_9BACT